jgi:ElaB/YqjD/DUF883 family membrane-anchored ribosome-binding protein
MEMPTEKLMHDLRVVVTDAEDLVKATAGQTGEHIEKARARAEESLRAARAGLKSAGRQIDAQLHEHPWTAVGVAAGAGLALGILLGRK